MPLATGIGPDCSEIVEFFDASRLNWREERERTLLSELIHDDALQDILAARQELAEAAKGDLGAVKRARPSLDAAHQSLRTLASDLSPVTLQSSSLDELVGAVVSTYIEGRDWALVAQLCEAIRPVHGQFLPRAARELLTNVAKHAQARKVVVTLEEVDDTVELCVRDDGIDFDPDDLSDVRCRAEPRHSAEPSSSSRARVALESSCAFPPPHRPPTASCTHTYM